MAKLEFFNPRKSLKEAPLVMIEDAEKGRLSKPETLIVEPTIGNAGIGLTFIFARGVARFSPCRVQGIGTGFIPDILQVELLNAIITVSNKDVFAMLKCLAKEKDIAAWW